MFLMRLIMTKKYISTLMLSLSLDLALKSKRLTLSQ